MSIGDRLREERERLGLTQDEFGVACGVRRRAQSSYENGERSPVAIYLEDAEKIGVDVRYVITGKRSAEFSPVPSEIDVDILEGTLANLSLVEMKLGRLPPNKQARIAATLYREFCKTGKVDFDTVKAVAELAKNL